MPKKLKAKWEPCFICGVKKKSTKYADDGKKYCNRHNPNRKNRRKNNEM